MGDDRCTFEVFQTALGWFGVTVSGAGEVMTVDIADQEPSPAMIAARLPAGVALGGRDAGATRGVREEIERYAAGELTEFAVPVRLFGTPFQLDAWRALRGIPFGQTRSYAQQAAAIGRAAAARAVGAANGRNRVAVIVPCHRVIGSGGALVGFAGGVQIKKRLLEHERAVAARLGCAGGRQISQPVCHAP